MTHSNLKEVCKMASCDGEEVDVCVCDVRFS